MPWRNTLGANLRHMTPEQAQSSLRRIQLRIGIAEQPEVVRLTGLANSRITPSIVADVCEKLAEKAYPNQRRAFDPTEQAD